MKHFLSVLLLAMIACVLLATSGDPKMFAPDQLTSDRIRNVMAVDNHDNLYAATFGLEVFNPLYPDRIPNGIAGQLIKFRIVDGTNYPIHDREYVILDGPFLGMGESFNCYSEKDIKEMENYFKKEEIDQRVDGGTGCWASPVIYQDGNSISDVVYILNKSGMLFCIRLDFGDGHGECLWAVNLRELEGYSDENAQFEYMATPTLFKDELYVTGIKSFFAVDRNSGNITYRSYFRTLPAGDHFVTPLVFDTNADARDFYAISKKGRMFRMAQNLAGYSFYNNSLLSKCYAPPLLDNSGHVYFTGMKSHNLQPIPMFNFTSQTLRYNLNGIVREEFNFNTDEYGYGGTLLADSYKGIYFMGDHSIDYYLKEYNFDNFTGSLHYDPLRFHDPEHVDMTSNSRCRYVNNHPALMEQATEFASLIASINNSVPEPTYYPSNPTLADISHQNVVISYVVNNYENGNVHLESTTSPTNSLCSWGGITPFAALCGRMNIIFGDEEGKIFTYQTGIPELGNFNLLPPNGESDLCLYTPFGFGKHQQGKDNIVRRKVVDLFKVNVRRENDFPTYVYVNAYGRGTQEANISFGGENDIPVFWAYFRYLPVHPRYTITILQEYPDGFHITTLNDVDISQGDILVNPNGKYTVVTDLTQLDVDPETTSLGNEDQIPIALSMDSNSPNPFNPSTSIKFSIPTDGNVKLTIYNIKGQVVKELINKEMSAGQHNIVWNGTDSSYCQVSSGLYYARIEQGSTIKHHKMMLLK